MRVLPWVVLSALASLAGCGSRYDEDVPPTDRGILEGAEELMIFALRPHPTTAEEPLKAGEEAFHDFKVLGRATVADARRAELIELVRKGIDASDGVAALCFLPRHGVRATGRGNDVVDLVICYECFQMVVYGADGERTTVLTAASVEPAVTRLFEDHGLKIQRD